MLRFQYFGNGNQEFSTDTSRFKEPVPKIVSVDSHVFVLIWVSIGNSKIRNFNLRLFGFESVLEQVRVVHHLVHREL